MKHNTLKSKNGDILLLYCHIQEKYHSWPQIHGISGRRLKKIASVTTSMLNSRYLCSCDQAVAEVGNCSNAVFHFFLAFFAKIFEYP